MSEEVSWLNHAITAALAAVGTFGLMVAGAFVRLWRHEERIKAIEDSAQERADALTSLSEKVDAYHAATGERIDTSLEGVRSDLRIIMSRCLTVEHGDRR